MAIEIGATVTSDTGIVGEIVAVANGEAAIRWRDGRYSGLPVSAVIAGRVPRGNVGAAARVARALLDAARRG